MFNIALCDDKVEDIDIISKELYKAADDMGIDIEIYPHNDGNKIVDLLLDSKEDTNVLFLDIDMPDITGFEVAKLLRDNGSNIIIVFVSSHSQYVYSSIDYMPFAYIRKSKLEDEIGITLNKAYKRFELEKKKSFIAKTDEGIFRINNSDIIYIETESRKKRLYTSKGDARTLVGRQSIKELCKELNDEDFIQIHSGCIVNVKYVKEYLSYAVVLDDGKKLIVSRRRIKEVQDALLRYWRKRV